MTRKRWALLLMLVACVGVFGAWLLWPRTAITRQNADKIQVGMTLAEVEAILGGPSRNEANGPLLADGDEDESWVDLVDLANLVNSDSTVCWTSNEILIMVSLDPAQKVEQTESFPAHRRSENMMDTFRRWFGL
jgi:hypothetical protein